MHTVESEHLEGESVSKVLQRYMAVLGELERQTTRAECVVMMGASLKWNNLMRGSRLAVDRSPTSLTRPGSSTRYARRSTPGKPGCFSPSDTSPQWRPGSRSSQNRSIYATTWQNLWT